MIAGFTGTREGLTWMQICAVGKLFADLKVSELAHGDSLGADCEAHLLAVTAGIPVTLHPPSDFSLRAFCTAKTTHDPKPYLVRDEAIVEACSLLIAAPREAGRWEEALRSGTWATVRRARKAGKRIYVVRPTGKVHDGGEAEGWVGLFHDAEEWRRSSSPLWVMAVCRDGPPESDPLGPFTTYEAALAVARNEALKRDWPCDPKTHPFDKDNPGEYRRG
jgi:hypothetical protein